MSVQGSCHCGAVRFEAPEAPTRVFACNCSICARRGALHAYYPADQFTLLTPPEALATYQWGRRLGSHCHCPVCGCPAFVKGPRFRDGKPDFERMMVGVNARLLDGFDPEAVEIVRIDGKAFPAG
jgi:hypothetical protein